MSRLMDAFLWYLLALTPVSLETIDTLIKEHS